MTEPFVAVALYFVPVARVKVVEMEPFVALTDTRAGLFGRGFGATRMVGAE